MGTVALRNVTKSFGAVEVIHGISVEIAEGEFLVLVGPSGCGKSTLLRMLAGLEDISGGEIEIGGKVVNGLDPKDRDIAMVFQSYALYPHMSVAENMGFSLRLAGRPKSAVRAAAAGVADILGLAALLDRYPRQLSGGQRQRVAMGRAMVRDPKVFLFDEPLSNLDAKLRVQMRSEIKLNHQRLGTTTVYVTHDQIEAMTLADRIVVMHDGRVEQIGTPLELYDRPANRFVAGFIGSPTMNMIEGAVIGGRFVAIDGTEIAVTGGPDVRATLGIRPEHMHLDPDGVAAEVVTVEPTGPETHVMMRMAGHDLAGVFRERIAQGPGSVLRIGFDAAELHLFNAASGLRLPNDGREQPLD